MSNKKREPEVRYDYKVWRMRRLGRMERRVSELSFTTDQLRALISILRELVMREGDERVQDTARFWVMTLEEMIYRNLDKRQQN